MDQLSQAIPVVAGVCVQGDRFLLSERRAGTHLAGCWEFAGGKINPGESPEAALKREWLEELGVEISKADPWTFIYREYSEKNILLLFFYVEVVGDPTPQEGQRLRWVTAEEAHSMKLAPADAQAVGLLQTP